MTKTILIVDDSPTMRQMLQFACESRGFSVLTAKDGQEGLEVLKREQVDLVVLDIHMPHLDGLSMLEIVRQRQSLSSLPVVVLTTGGDKMEPEQAMARGATEYMTKPRQPSELLDRVEEILHSGRHIEPDSQSVLEEEMNHRILVVEDSRTQALRAQLLLTEAGYQVETAENGQIGLNQALADPPDLVIADVVMPVMNGYEMTRRLKANPRTALVPVLMLTTQDQPLDIIRGLEVGADHFLTKPYADTDLVQRVKDLLDALKKARAGQLPEQQAVARFSEEIVITKSREQVLQALLEAAARILDCDAMGLLLHSRDEWPLFVLSFRPLEASTLGRLASMMTSVLAKLGQSIPDVKPTQTVSIVAESEPDRPSKPAALHRAFMHAPLLIEGEITGLIGVFSSKPEAFDLRHVRFLFEMGQKAAEALSRVRLEKGDAPRA